MPPGPTLPDSGADQAEGVAANSTDPPAPSGNDEPPRRRRGRPPKLGSGAGASRPGGPCLDPEAAPQAPKRGRGRLRGSGRKGARGRGRVGRPPGAGGASTGRGRGRGRARGRGRGRGRAKADDSEESEHEEVPLELGEDSDGRGDLEDFDDKDDFFFEEPESPVAQRPPVEVPPLQLPELPAPPSPSAAGEGGCLRLHMAAEMWDCWPAPAQPMRFSAWGLTWQLACGAAAQLQHG